MTLLQVETTIDAPIERVWRILADFQAYGEWNRFTPQVECSGQVGDPVRLTARLGKRQRAVHLTLTSWQPPHKICWGSDRWYLRVNRCQTLASLADGKTLYQSKETFEGPLAPLVIWTLRSKLLRGYRLGADGLKRKVEQ